MSSTSPLQGFWYIDVAFGVLLLVGLLAIGIFGLNLSTIYFFAGVVVGYILKVVERVMIFQNIVNSQIQDTVQKEAEEQVEEQVEEKT